MMHTQGDEDDHVVKKTTEKEFRAALRPCASPGAVVKMSPSTQTKILPDVTAHVTHDTSELDQYVSK